MRRDVRLAGAGDLPALSEMLRAARAEMHPGNAHHPAHCIATLRRLIADPAGFVGVAVADGAPVGLVVAVASGALWHPGVMAQCVLRWVVSSERGRWAGRLERAFEEWAEAQGATVLGLSQTGRAAGRVYARQGYLPAEMMYFKEV